MKRKVKIISISGMPVSGKSTAIQGLKQKYIENGIKEEDIHILSVGRRFREYFNKIINFIKNIESTEGLQEFIEDEDIKKIFENKEFRSQISDIIAALKLMGYKTEDFDINKANNDPNFEGIRKIVDEIVDRDIERIGKEVLDRNNENEVWLVDSRLAFNNIPESFSVRLTVDNKVAGERLLGDNSRGKEDNMYNSIEEAQNAAKERYEGENERFKKLYGIDLENEDNYDLIIDTSYASPDDIVNTIIECEKRDREKREYGKTWASPKQFIPTQKIEETAGRGFGGYTFDDMVNVLKRKGYDPDKPISVAEYKGRKYIMEGHHRSVAAGYIGNTLIPFIRIYSDKDQDNEKVKKAEEWSKNTKLTYLYDHESALRSSFDDVYPGIYDELSNREKTNDDDNR